MNPQSQAQPRQQPQANQRIEVVVTDFDMPFSKLVTFLVKLALASIPATIILAFIFFGISIFFTIFFGAFVGLL